MDKAGVIIVAGGTGRRMGASVPKQFLKLNGEVILAVTIRRFRHALPDADIVVVLPKEEMERWQEICVLENIEDTHRVCIGGETRFHSVKNGCAALKDVDYIAVHDGVRPMVSEKMIAECFDTARKYGTAIPVVRPADSFRVVDGDGSHIIDRATLRAVQTPQVFRADILREAYKKGYSPEFTDDASVVEKSGVNVTLCEGDRSNIKITTPEDIAIAESIMKGL